MNLVRHARRRKRQPGWMRWLVLWIAVLGLVAAPVAATAHELTHLPDSFAKKGGGEGHATCELCGAYAGLGHAIAGSASLSPLVAPVAPDVFATTASAQPFTFVPYQERAPPLSF